MRFHINNETLSNCNTYNKFLKVNVYNCNNANMRIIKIIKFTIQLKEYIIKV